MQAGKIRKRLPLFFLGISLFIFFIAYQLQLKWIFSADVSYLVYAANQLLEGGQYVSDIFETNPPMILYLYFPICLLLKFTGLDIFSATRLYIYTLIFISSGICYYLLKKLIQPSDRIYFYGFFYTLLFVFLILPTVAFGQREHLFLIFLIPYLLAAVLALENKSIPSGLAFFIGLSAGAVFALKPFFLVTLGLIELYVMLKKRHIFAWIRLEFLVLVFVLLMYLFILCMFHPSYITVVLPFVLHYYFPGAIQKWNLIFSNSIVTFCLSVMLSFLFFCQLGRLRTLGTLLWLALTGTVAAFIIARSAWFYHILPAFALASLLVMHYLLQGMEFCFLRYTSYKIIIRDVMALIMMAFIIFFTPFYITFQLNIMKSPMDSLVTYINSRHGERSIFCMTSTGTGLCFPLIYLTHSQFAQRFPFLWWFNSLPSMEKKNFSTQIAKDKSYFIKTVVDDLNKYQARWVISDTLNTHPDYIDYLSADNKFREAWQHYRFLTRIEKFVIYERLENSKDS